MTHDPSSFVKRIRHLSLALIISGSLNIGILSLLLYWILRERPPTPYCEFKPASYDEQQVALADRRGFTEMLTQLSHLSFAQLTCRLSHTQLVEDGYAERDLALACLIAFHHFDIQRALPKDALPRQKRLFAWKPESYETPITLVLYPELTQQQFDAIIHFAKTEHWPLTAKGLFSLLKKQKQNHDALDLGLVDTFTLTSEFWTVELLFNHSEQRVNKEEILYVILDGEWAILKQFVDQQRQLNDQSDARRQKFLLDYLKIGSFSAVRVLLKTDWDFSTKKLDDGQILMILKLLPSDQVEGERFAKEMLLSPRGANVWKQASYWLYKHAGQPYPHEWNYQMAIAHFIPEKLAKDSATSISSVSLPVTVSLSIPKSPPSASLSSIELKKSAMNQKLSASNPSQPNDRLYVVEEGDSLWKISRRFRVDIETLKKHNRISSDAIKPGMILKIP